MNKTKLQNNYTLRISATSACNLNCNYCNPKRNPNPNILSDKDLLKIVEAGASTEIKRVIWTGGEPTVREGFINLVKNVKALGVRQQHLTTNGILYYKMADKLKEAGITRVNLSLDILDRNQYKNICGVDGFNYVIDSIKKATELYSNTKINCVITKNNFSTIDDFVKFTEEFQGKLTVRFLELVPCGQIYDEDITIFEKNFVSIYEILNCLKKYGDLIPLENKGNVPKSLYFRISGLKGIYGVNPNYSANYRCDREKCTKIRVNPEGLVSNCAIRLEYVRDFRNKTLKERKKLMKEIVLEKLNRNYTGFCHKQKYYDFWRFGILPKYIKEKFYS